MGRKQTSLEQGAKTTGGSRRRGKDVAPASLEDLRSHRDTTKKNFLKAKNTNTVYAGHVKRGRAFIRQVASRAVDIVFNESDGQPSAQAEIGDDEAIDYDVLAVALDGPQPNRYSPYALELFMTEKCFTQGCGKSLIEQVHAAFKDQWSMMGNGRYRGKWSCDPKTGEVSGNPADSPEIEDLLRSMKNRYNASGSPRDHAEAMKIEDLRKMMNWSLQQCPQELVDSILAQIETGGQPQCTVETLLHITKHVEIRGFYSSAFVLWTRNQELCSLQGKHYTLDCEGEEPYNLPYDRIRLALRKGWTRKNGNPSMVIGRNYRIFNSTKLPEINMHLHLRRWRTWLERVLLRRSLLPDDYVFPTISVNGQVQIKTHITNTVVQDWLKETCAAVKLTVVYTTHSFRRGGAQFRFMWCPIGQRWSLSAIRWWGGWADGEHADTLIKYLLDELNEYENSHENQLCPLRTEAKESFMGDHIRVGQVSAEEVREAALAMKRQAEAMLTAVQPFVAALNGNSIMMMPQFAPQSSHYPHGMLADDATNHLPPADGAGAGHYGGLQTVPQALDNGPHHLQAIPCTNTITSESAPASDLDANIDPRLRRPPHVESTTMSAAPTFEAQSTQPYAIPSMSALPAATWPLAPWQTAPWLYHPASQPLLHPMAYPAASCFPQAVVPPAHPIAPTGRPSESNAHQRAPRSIQPITEAIIPKLPRGANAWRLAVEQWEEVDPDTDRALKDWPEEWYKGVMGSFNGAKYGQRRMVALEFIDTFNRDEDAFVLQYPEAKRGFAPLLEAIRQQQIARKERSARPGRSSSQD